MNASIIAAADVPPGGTRSGDLQAVSESATAAAGQTPVRRSHQGALFTRALNAALVCRVCAVLLAPVSASAADLFRDATQAYGRSEYTEAARMFRESAVRQPAPGTLRNLGNAEWQLGRVGEAILAWERAQWLKPDEDVRNNLRFARRTMQMDGPELRWYEIASTWLPVDWWGWIAGASLAIALGMVTLPTVLRRPREGWHQAVGVFALAGFLLCVPALAGVHTRTRIGFVLDKDTPLRLTPTGEAQAVTRLRAGEPGRLLRRRGDYVFVRTSRAVGWLNRGEFGLVCADR